MPTIPKVKKTAYNQVWRGAFGQFGTGRNAQVVFLQSAMPPDDLQRTTLIGDIPGSEKWRVRDLFQREVDEERVKSSVLPYFQDRSKVKFFNPLTLTALPIDPQTGELFTALPDLKEFEEKEDGHTWQVLEMEEFYRYRHIKGEKYFAEFKWNDSKVKIVAIDGQHRLSALKRFHNDTEHAGRAEFEKWDIPFVLAAVASGDQVTRQGLLDVIRSIFVYVNTTAVKLNEEREILLSDESPNMVCTQEWLNSYHSNDTKRTPIPTKLPLLLFDWRGTKATTRGASVQTAAILSIKELKAWLHTYLLGEDFADPKEDRPNQRTSLSITPEDKALHLAFNERTLPPEANKKLRAKFGATVLPGIDHVLANFTPIREYAKAIRQLERATGGADDVTRHAFYRLKFYADRDMEKAVKRQVDEKYSILLEDISVAKDKHFGSKAMLGHDIGMRGVISAYAQLREFHQKTIKKSVTWEETAIWFVRGLNACYAAGWFDWDKGAKGKLLLQVARDSNDSVRNYRLSDVPEALGTHLAIVAAAYCKWATDVPSDDGWDQLWDEKSERLERTLQKGFEREERVKWKEDYDNTKEGKAELKRKVQSEAKKKVKAHIKSLEQHLPDFTVRSKAKKKSKRS